MSKRAEEAALEAYPVKMTPLVYQDLIDQFGGKTEIDVNTYPRCLFQEAYEQAEKDLTLTWRDIMQIVRFFYEEDGKYEEIVPHLTYEEMYNKVLQRYNEWREKK